MFERVAIILLGLTWLGWAHTYVILCKTSDDFEDVAYQLWQERCKDIKFSSMYCIRRP